MDDPRQSVWYRPVCTVLFGLAMVWCLVGASSGAQTLGLGTMLGLAGVNLWRHQTKPLVTRLLQLSVIGLGAGMNLGVVWEVGRHGIGYTIAGILFTFLVGLLLGRWAKLSENVSILLTSGTAICGGSAIAAVAGVLKPTNEETTIALMTVFMFNAIALLVFPMIGEFLGMSQGQFGLWAALAIHDTSSVVGAASAYGEEALNLATTVKLARSLWIAPVSLVIGWVMARRGEKGNGAPPTIPVFILGFLAAAALVSWVPALKEPGQQVAALARKSLLLTLFLTGSNLSREALATVGWKPTAVGGILWVIVSAATLAVIRGGWIGQ